MSFWSNPLKSITKTFTDPVGAFKNAWNSGGRDLLLGGPAYAAGAGVYRDWKDSVADAADPDRTADDYNSPESIAFSREMMPTQDHPALRRWQDASYSAALGAGANQAAAASARKRMGVTGAGQLSRLAPEYWQRLMSLALDIENERASIPTTSTDASFLRGFTGSGGAQSIGALLSGGGKGVA